MAIKGLGFDMMSAYNRIGVNDPVKVPEVKQVSQEVKEQSQEELSGVKVNLNIDSIRRRPNADIEDIAKKQSKPDFMTFRLDDQLMKNDMDKAVAAMEKDSSLRQYQYFVGDTNIITDDEDGLVFIK